MKKNNPSPKNNNGGPRRHPSVDAAFRKTYSTWEGVDPYPKGGKPPKMKG